MKEKVINIFKLIICSICFFMMATLVSLILIKFGINISDISIKKEAIIEFVISLIILIVFILVYFKDIKKDFINFKKDLGKNISFIIKTFVLFMIIKTFAGFISGVIMQLVGLNTNSLTSVNQELIQKYLKSAPVLMLASCALLAPIYEEILFRLGFRKVLGNEIIFIIVSGFTFGLMHVFPLDEGVTLQIGIIQSISYVTMGLFLAYTYNKSDNIFCSIGVHFLNNFLSVITLLNFFR